MHSKSFDHFDKTWRHLLTIRHGVWPNQNNTTITDRQDNAYY